VIHLKTTQSIIIIGGYVLLTVLWMNKVMHCFYTSSNVITYYHIIEQNKVVSYYSTLIPGQTELLVKYPKGGH